MNARRLLAAALLGPAILLTGCEPGTGGAIGTCDPSGFGPLSGCSETDSSSASVSGDSSATYETLAALVESADFPARHEDDMVAIAMAESSGDLGVVSEPNSNGTHDRCAWQINDVHGFDLDRLVSDPNYCVAAAKQVYEIQGLGAWTVFNTGTYERYLDEARTAVG